MADINTPDKYLEAVNVAVVMDEASSWRAGIETRASNDTID